MTTSLKDVSSAQMINTLVNMNYFEQECTVYGYVWIDREGRRKYTTSDNALLIQQSFDVKELQGYLMSPIQQYSERTLINDENKEAVFFAQKLYLCKLLKEWYSDEYFSGLMYLQTIPRDNLAEPILKNWCNEIEGYYDQDAIQLFEGALKYSFKARHLSLSVYERFSQWVQEYKKQIGAQVKVKDNFRKKFFGIAYQNLEKKFSYICNANQEILFSRLYEMEKNSVFHTPVLEKEYFYHRSNDLKNVRKFFEQDLRLLMDESYFQKMCALQQLSREHGSACLDICLENIGSACSKKETEGIRFWVNRWNFL